MNAFQTLSKRWDRSWCGHMVSVGTLVPNSVTLAALASGLTAIRMSIDGRYKAAIGAIIVAAVLDGLDGRLARLLRSPTKFGAELDSLADIVSFGVAPALLYYLWCPPELRSIAWIVAVIFVAAGGLRLARFNAALDAPTQPDWRENFFVGMPIPAGALTVLLPIYLDLLGLPRTMGAAAASHLYCLFIAGLMVSQVPTVSGKRMRLQAAHNMAAPAAALALLVTALLVAFTWETLAVGTVIYLLTIPAGVAQFRRLQSRDTSAQTVSVAYGRSRRDHAR